MSLVVLPWKKIPERQLHTKLPADYPKLADHALELFDDACKFVGQQYGKHSVPYYLHGGTCLGFYRNGGYIKTDTDIDVGIILDDRERLWRLWIELWNKGFRSNGIASADAWSRHFFFQGIFLNTILSGEISPPYTIYGGYRCESFGKSRHNGRDYRVPSPVEDYLAYTYGKDWRIPMTFDWWSTHGVKRVAMVRHLAEERECV